MPGDYSMTRGERTVQQFQRGLLATLPLAPGVIAFGLLYGMLARQVGFSPWEALAMSFIVHGPMAKPKS